jgi:peptide/nickel transport system permease protein
LDVLFLGGEGKVLGFKGYLARRVAFAIFTLFVVITLNFAIFMVLPGDPTRYLIDPKMTMSQKEMIRHWYGLDDPFALRYVKYLRNMISFGLVPPYFGYSLVSHLTIASEMAWRLPLTVALLGSALIIEVLIGIPLGLFAASRRGSKTDATIMTAGLFTYGVPTFFVQLFALLFFISYVKQTYGILIFPPGGWYSYPRVEGMLPSIADLAWHFALPVATLVITGFAGWALYARNLLLDALTEDYVLTARAKGASERSVLFNHAFKAIRPPIVTLISLSIPGLITGAIITETIFGLQGIGQWYIESIAAQNADYPVVEAVLFLFAFLTIACNLVVDVIYGLLDPRIRVGQRR